MKTKKQIKKSLKKKIIKKKIITNSVKIKNLKKYVKVNKINSKIVGNKKIKIQKKIGTSSHHSSGDLKKLKIGVFGISGCAGCLLTFLFEDCFKEIVNLVDIKSFPLIKEEKYKKDFDCVFIEGTVCFDEDIVKLNELRKRSKKIVALGSCACVGGVPSIKNFLDSDKTMRLVYPVYNHLKPEPPTPIDSHIKVDYYIPQCPPSKEELVEFVKFIATNREFKPYRDPVCFECRKKGNLCLLTKNQICLGPITNGGCDALCPSNSVTCYGCRGPCKDANIKAFLDLLKDMGYTDQNMHDKMNTFAGLQFKESEGDKSHWLEK